MYKIYSGSTGSGKTSKLKAEYERLAAAKGSEKILLFLNSARAVSQFREEIDLKLLGNLNIYTYFGFVNQQLNKHWPAVERKYSGENQLIEPTFMNIETSHFLMSNYVAKYRKDKAYFRSIKARPVQIAVQLIDNLNLAAFNMLNFKELKQRLLSWTAKDEERKKYAEQSIEIMKTFRNFSFNYRLFDYSAAITLYNKYLLADKAYLVNLKDKYDYLLVDDLEKLVPAGQNLVKELSKNKIKGIFTFNESGGFNRFFGGNPAAAKKLFFENEAKIIKMEKNYTAASASKGLAGEIKDVVQRRKSNLVQSSLLLEEIDSELRGEMLIKVGQKVIFLLEKGVKPDQIAIISPKIDKVLSFSLKQILKQKGYQLSNFNRSKRLIDIPFARALLILYLFYCQRTNIVGVSSLQQALSLLLELDPLRSYILAEEIAASGMQLIDLDQSGLREKINFQAAEKYDYLKEWLEEKKEEELEIDVFFQLVFSEVLAPLNPSQEDIFACRQMIESVARFQQAVENFHQEKDDLSERYINMIYEGTLAAETLFKGQEKEAGVILASPYKFLFSPELAGVDYLFLLDISSSDWMQSIAKELVNPYIYTEQWQQENDWDDFLDQKIRLNQLSDFLVSLIYKVKKGIYIADSFLNSSGKEQEGPLYRWLDVRGD
ncbi:MAG: UvrD-helicase domain-containing protein [Bacillota bacterium]